MKKDSKNTNSNVLIWCVGIYIFQINKWIVNAAPNKKKPLNCINIAGTNFKKIASLIILFSNSYKQINKILKIDQLIYLNLFY